MYGKALMSESRFATSIIEGQVPGRGMMLSTAQLPLIPLCPCNDRNDDNLIRFPFADAARDEVAVSRRRVVAR